MDKTNLYYTNVLDSTKFEYTNKSIDIKDVIEGCSQLATDGIAETTELISAIHKEIVISPFPKVAQGYVQIAYESTIGKIYSAVKSIMLLSGNSTTQSLRIINAKLLRNGQNHLLPFNANALISLLNGSIGDTLFNNDNPMALPMLVYDHTSKVHDLQNLTGNIVLCVHGLCMNHKYWKPNKSEGLGYKIAQRNPDTKVLYLEYNSGRRISNNGDMLSALLTKVVQDNPEITSIKMIGHSMGGLVLRSAMFYAEQNHAPWLEKMTHYVAIGSPHNGALLERLSYIIQDSLSKIPYAGNFSRLVNLRSAGILDLRYGSVRHQDWKQLGDRIGIADDVRHPCFLPKNVECFLIAASMSTDFFPSLSNNIGDGSRDPTDVIGDGLVTVDSALGEHERAEYNLNVPDSNKMVFYDIDHMNILHLDAMHEQVFTWFHL